MSQQVANISLAGAAVGQNGTLVSFQNLVPPPTLAQQMRPQDTDAVSHLVIFNETGCQLLLILPDSNQTKTLSAGRWLNLAIPAHESAVLYQVQAVAQGIFNNLLADFYRPGEPVEELGVLGNSPIGVSGTVSTTTTSALKNDGSGPGTQIVESTPSDQGTSAFSLNNDGSGFWQVLSAGVQRIVANITRGNAGAGKAIIVIGDAGDTSITTLHGTADKATNATNALNTGDGASGGYITAADSGTALDIHPIVGANRMLNLSMRDTGGVLRSILRTSSSGATTFLDSVGIQLTAGKITNYNGQTLAGLGVSPIVAQAIDVAVTSTALQTILSYTPPTVGPYRVTIAIQLNNNISGNKITAVLNWTDRTLGAGSTDSVTFISPSAGSPIVSLNGVTSVLNQGVIAFPMTVMSAANQPMTIQYQDPTNTPNDLVSVIIERMA